MIRTFVAVDFIEQDKKGGVGDCKRKNIDIRKRKTEDREYRWKKENREVWESENDCMHCKYKTAVFGCHFIYISIYIYTYISYI